MAAIRSRKDRKNPNPEQPASVSSASIYRSRALIQSLSNATRAAKVEGPAIPGSAHATPTTSSSLRSKLELLGPAVEQDELMSEGQRQLHRLLRKQLDTSTSFEGTLRELQGKEFTPAVVFKPLADEVKGLHSLDDYQTKEQEYVKRDQLRQLGLTGQEIELKEKGEEWLQPSTAKRAKLGADPKAQQDRMEALSQKLHERELSLREPIKYSGAKPMSRHAMEIEKSLYRDTSSGNPLGHLTVEDRHHAVLYPKSVIPDKMSDKNSSGSRVPDALGEDEAFQAAASTDDSCAVVADPDPLPVQVIERNRLSVAEIRALPRFRDYSPGAPSKVLYLKNLHHKVKKEDLLAVFGCFRERTSDSQEAWPRVKVMSGRMKGQAFVEFDSIEVAKKAMKLVNGYIMGEKPVIISYGRTTNTST